MHTTLCSVTKRSNFTLLLATTLWIKTKSFLCGLSTLRAYIVTMNVWVFTTHLNTVSDDDAIVVLHMHDGVVWHHLTNKQSWTLCILYWQCHFNKVDRMPTSTIFFMHFCPVDLELFVQVWERTGSCPRWVAPIKGS